MKNYALMVILVLFVKNVIFMETFIIKAIPNIINMIVKNVLIFNQA